MRILADPELFHGRPVRVGGYLHLEFEGDQLCLNRDDVAHVVVTNCVWVQVPDSRTHPELRELSDRYVGVEGVVNAERRGHFGMYQATIENVSMVSALPTRDQLEAKC